tara:strand:+ start:330 stop:758 length:429 start_codon:yes stop_codon:yes gene_type:complete
MKRKKEGSEDDYDDQVDLAGNIIPTLYEALGEDQSDESKKIKLTQIRAAIGTALYKHFTAPVVAEALGLHRDSITQYKKKHPKNLLDWKGYDYIFLIVQCTLDSILDIETTRTNIEILSRKILKLEETKNKLEKTINETLVL